MLKRVCRGSVSGKLSMMQCGGDLDLDLDLDILSLRKTLHNKESYRKAIIVVNDKTCKIHSKRTQKNLKIREK